MTSRLLTGAIATALALGIAWLLVLRGGPAAPPWLAISPATLTLRPGEQAEIQVLNYRYGTVAVRFQLRFDEEVVTVEGAGPARAALVDGGDMISLPVRHAPGLLVVPGAAVTGRHVFGSPAVLYRFTLRALAPGTTALALEDGTLIDLHARRHTAPAYRARVVVRGR